MGSPPWIVVGWVFVGIGGLPIAVEVLRGYHQHLARKPRTMPRPHRYLRTSRAATKAIATSLAIATGFGQPQPRDRPTPA